MNDVNSESILHTLSAALLWRHTFGVRKKKKALPHCKANILMVNVKQDNCKIEQWVARRHRSRFTQFSYSSSECYQLLHNWLSLEPTFHRSLKKILCCMSSSPIWNANLDLYVYLFFFFFFFLTYIGNNTLQASQPFHFPSKYSWILGYQPNGCFYQTLTHTRKYFCHIKKST